MADIGATLTLPPSVGPSLSRIRGRGHHTPRHLPLSHGVGEGGTREAGG